MPSTCLDHDVTLAASQAPDLIPGPALSRIREVARHLPLMMAGFECRMEAPESRVDMSVSCRPEILKPAHIKALAQAAPHHPNTPESRAWQRLTAFCKTWTDPASALNRRLSRFWLEFDLDSGTQGAVLPRLFAPLADAPEQSRGRDRGLERIRQILCPLFDTPLAPDLKEALARTAASLPRGCRLFSIGTGLAQDPGTLRLSLTGLSPETAPAWLASHLPWDMDARAWHQALAPLKGLPGYMVTALDVGCGHVPAKAGFALKFAALSRNPANLANQANSTLIRRLEAAGLCTNTGADTLCRWESTSPLQKRPAPPGDAMGRGLSFLGVAPVLVRKIHHIKLQIRPGARPSAKAYLSFMRRMSHQGA